MPDTKKLCVDKYETLEDWLRDVRDTNHLLQRREESSQKDKKSKSLISSDTHT